MRLKSHILLLPLLFLAGITAWSQQSSSSASEVAELEQIGVLNEAVISPDDLDEEQLIHEDNDNKPLSKGHKAAISILGSENFVSVYQTGSGNITKWVQSGNLNVFDLEQDGGGNEHEGSLAGSNNTIVVRQYGQLNFIYQDLAGNEMDIEVIQDGYGHEFIQEINPTTIDPVYKVRQEGNHGMRVVIKQEKLF